MNKENLPEEKTNDLQNKVGDMQKRREVMPDGKRYIIYYTFEEKKEQASYSESNSKSEDQ